MTSQTPIDIVTAMLDAFARGDVTAGIENVDDNIVYSNVSLPTVYGKRKVHRIFRGMEDSSWAGFDYRMINVSADGPVVLTERIDQLRFGPLVIRFWVWGRFEVGEGRITLWRDYFDYFDMTKGLLRGLLAIVAPAAQRRMPAPAPASVS